MKTCAKNCASVLGRPLWIAILSWSYFSFHALGDSAIIGPNEKVALLYEDNGDIIVKPCRYYTILTEESPWRTDCKHASGTEILTIPVFIFRKSLDMALNIPGDYGAEMQRKIQIYNTNFEEELENRLKLLATRGSLELRIDVLEAFHRQYGEKATGVGLNTLLVLREGKEQVSTSINESSDIIDQIDTGRLIEEQLNTLIEEISNAEHLISYVVPAKKRRGKTCI